MHAASVKMDREKGVNGHGLLMLCFLLRRDKAMALFSPNVLSLEQGCDNGACQVQAVFKKTNVPALGIRSHDLNYTWSQNFALLFLGLVA